MRRELDGLVFELLSGNESARNVVIPLVTVGKDSLPNVCLLSPFQVFSKDKRTLLVVVHKKSRTRKNLERNRAALVLVFLPPAAYYIKCKAQTYKDTVHSKGGSNDVFVLHVVEFKKDYSATSSILSGPTFEESEVRAEYARMQRRLRSFAGLLGGKT